MGKPKDDFMSAAVKKLNRSFMKNDSKNQDDSKSNKTLDDKSSNAVPTEGNSSANGKVISKLNRIGKFNLIFENAGIQLIFKEGRIYSSRSIEVNSIVNQSDKAKLLIKASKALSKTKKKITLSMQSYSKLSTEMRDASTYTLLLSSFIYSKMLKEKITFERFQFARMQRFVDAFESFLISPEELKVINKLRVDGKLGDNSYFNSYVSQFSGGMYASHEQLGSEEYHSNTMQHTYIIVAALTVFLYTFGIVSGYDRNRLTPEEEQAYSTILDLLKGESPLLKFMGCHFEATDILFGYERDLDDREKYNHDSVTRTIVNTFALAHEPDGVHVNRRNLKESDLFNHRIKIPVRVFVLPEHLKERHSITPQESTLKVTYGILPKDYQKVKGLLNAVS